jgi:cell wall-associated NlpC family hydrolase
MQPTRILLSMLCVAFALAVALVRPAPGRADEAAAAPVRTTQFHLPFAARVVGFARHLIGVRYVYGGTTPRSGFDCSGLVRYVYAHFGISLPHSSYAQFDRGRRVARRGLRPGDLLFFDGLGHVGMYVGNGRFIHAPHTGTRVRVERLAGWYSARLVGARRLRST